MPGCTGSNVIILLYDYDRLAYDPAIRAAFTKSEPADVDLWPLYEKVTSALHMQGQKTLLLLDMVTYARMVSLFTYHCGASYLGSGFRLRRRGHHMRPYHSATR